MLHESIVVLSKRAVQGNGLFATKPITMGTVIWSLDEPSYSMDEIKSWSENKLTDFYHYGFQCGIDRFSLPKGDCREMNHSCDPNTWWYGSDTLIARRDILIDEEITYDYASSEIAIDLAMRCHCGSKNCRKIITNNDYRDPEWQKQYGSHLPAHVLDAIKALSG